MNANPGALDSADGQSPSPAMKGICFSCAAQAAPLRSKAKFKIRSSHATNQRKPLFDLGQLVATPGALAALEKAGQNAMEFLSRHVTAIGATFPKKTRKKTNSAWRTVFGS